MSEVFWKAEDLEEFAEAYPQVQQGCLVDTNILISANLTLDPFNEEIEDLFKTLSKLKIPVYCNVNVRSEFLEIYRRILIPECLIELLDAAEAQLDDLLVAKLKSVKTSYRKAIDAQKIYKFNDDRIKEFRSYFESKSTADGKNGWQIFCEHYLLPRITPVWDQVVKQCGVNTIKLRYGEKNPLIDEPISWDRAVELMGRFGMGSGDAMILNLFLCSKLKLIVTADGDLHYVQNEIANRDKFVMGI